MAGSRRRIGDGRTTDVSRVTEGSRHADGSDAGAMGCAPAPAADEPRTPQRIALVTASGDAGLDFLLEDFRAAYVAYSRLAGCELPEFASVGLGESGVPAAEADVAASRAQASKANTAASCPRAVEPTGGAASKFAGAADRATSALTGTAGNNATGPCQDTGEAADSVVFACDGVVDVERLREISWLVKPGTRLHVIFDLPGFDPALADDAAHMFIDLCKRSGALWCGGIAIAGERPFEVLRRSPRMGLLRRPFSEAMDMLVGSVRMGCSVRRSQELGGADVHAFDELGLVRATPALPPSLWNLVMQALGKVRRMHRGSDAGSNARAGRDIPV